MEKRGNSRDNRAPDLKRIKYLLHTVQKCIFEYTGKKLPFINKVSKNTIKALEALSNTLEELSADPIDFLQAQKQVIQKINQPYSSMYYLSNPEAITRYNKYKKDLIREKEFYHGKWQAPAGWTESLEQEFSLFFESIEQAHLIQPHKSLELFMGIIHKLVRGPCPHSIIYHLQEECLLCITDPIKDTEPTVLKMTNKEYRNRVEKVITEVVENNNYPHILKMCISPKDYYKKAGTSLNA